MRGLKSTAAARRRQSHTHTPMNLRYSRLLNTDRRPSRAKRRRDGNVNEEARQEEKEEEEKDCPICTNRIGRRRTKSYPFSCAGSVRHFICSDCNRRMFDRHDDSCPFCRAARCDAAAMGSRPPRPIRDEDGGVSVSALEIVDSLFGDRNVSLGGMFTSFPVVGADNDDEREDGQQGGEGAMLAIAISRSSSDAVPVSSVVDSIRRDPAFRAAFYGLTNPHMVGVRAFRDNMRQHRQLYNSQSG